jgi:hypothetical protein
VCIKGEKVLFYLWAGRGTEDRQKHLVNALRDQSPYSTWKAGMNKHKVGSNKPLVDPFISIFCIVAGMWALGYILGVCRILSQFAP